MTHHMALHNVLGRIHTILKQDDYFRTLKELPAIDGLHAYDVIQLFPELFDMPAVIERITSKADLIEKQLNRSGMYPLPWIPLPSTSGFIPRPSSTFRPITPAAPPHATEEAKPPQTPQSQESSPGSSIPCGQGTPTATSSQPPGQSDDSTSSQTPEATVPDTPEEKIPKSLNGEGVKNSRKQATTSTTATQDSRLCFRCKQPGHLKKDCPELLYCSKCRTQGHIAAKCPTKQQDDRWHDKRHESTNKRCKTQREDWKKSQDRPQFSNKTNKCLNCAGDHGTKDCPNRQQPQTPSVSNPANGPGIDKNSSQPHNNSPQQHSQQSASIMNI